MRQEQASIDPSPAKIVTVASVAGAAALAGVIAILFAVSSNGDADRATDLRATLSSDSACAPTSAPAPAACSALRRALENKYEHRDSAVGFGLAAGALLVTDVLLFLLWPSPTATRAAHVVAVPLGRDGGMLGWRTSF